MADEVGGRTKSVWLPNGLWINYGAQYITDDRPHVVALADAVGVELLKGLGESPGVNSDRCARGAPEAIFAGLQGLSSARPRERGSRPCQLHGNPFLPVNHGVTSSIGRLATAQGLALVRVNRAGGLGQTLLSQTLLSLLTRLVRPT